MGPTWGALSLTRSGVRSLVTFGPPASPSPSPTFGTSSELLRKRAKAPIGGGGRLTGGALSLRAPIFNTARMNYTRARGRYLAALGLTGVQTAFAAGGCRAEEPTTPVPTVAIEGTAAVTVTAAPVQSTAPTAPEPAAHKSGAHSGPWVPTVEVAPAPPRRMGACPHGPFCLPQPEAPGASPAPEPYQSCADTVPIPAGAGPSGTVRGRTPGVTFNPALTAAERAGDPAACCYQWHVLCVGGRALRGPEGPVVAATVLRGDWLAAAGGVEVGALSPSRRDALAAHWEREAAFEHASVAAFAQASLALLAVGAPADLVAATHEAAIDEVEHARLAYGLASAYGGSARGPGSLAGIGPTVPASLAALARDTFLDGCAGEAAAALALREAAAMATDGAVRAILTRIAEDEERHAELAWRTVAWALRTGGEEVAHALREATATLAAELTASAPEAPASEEELAAHGALGEGARRAIRARALAEVVIPCADALLAPPAMVARRGTEATSSPGACCIPQGPVQRGSLSRTWISWFGASLVLHEAVVVASPVKTSTLRPITWRPRSSARKQPSWGEPSARGRPTSSGMKRLVPSGITEVSTATV